MSNSQYPPLSMTYKQGNNTLPSSNWNNKERNNYNSEYTQYLKNTNTQFTYQNYNYSQNPSHLTQKTQKDMEQNKFELDLSVKQKTRESEDRIEPMKITIITSYKNKNQNVRLEITSPHDPLVLYTLEINETEFHHIKNEQSLWFDFQSFPQFWFDMLNRCINDQTQCYVCIWNKINVNDGLFIILERTQFREVNHIVLMVQQANDANVKKYWGLLSTEFKEKYNETFAKWGEWTKQYETLVQENDTWQNEIAQERIVKKSSWDSLSNEKNKEINQVKEQCFLESKSQLEELERNKNKWINDLERKVASMQRNIDEVVNENKILKDLKVNLEIAQRDLEGKYAISNTELNVYKNDISNWRQDNSMLNQKCFKQEKEITELTFKHENLLKQIEEKNKGQLNLGTWVDTLTKQRDSFEDTVKSLKAMNSKLEDKWQSSINEINKGNEIIQKLQNEIKNQKSKLKSTKQAWTSQEHLTQQKQILWEEQIRTLNEVKRDNEKKEQEIISMKNQITNYSVKWSDNEKWIEDNKQMIMYLNKNLNDTVSNPFKSRGNIYNNYRDQNQMMYNTSSSGGSISPGLRGGNNTSSTYNYNSDINSYNIPNVSATNFNQAIPSNFNNNNINNNNYSNTNMNNIQTERFRSSGMNNTQEQLQGSVISGATNDLMILPETNFCGYKQQGNSWDKYLGNTATATTLNNGNVLNHKYGNSMNNTNMKGDGSMVNSLNNTNKHYNIEDEEYPMQMEQPQPQLPVLKQ